MRILNFGSINIDYVYRVPHFVQAGETLSSAALQSHCGGKGLNQSVALAKAGAPVFHAGAIGNDGDMTVEFLRKSGVDVTGVRRTAELTGHAIIQVDARGQNCILLHSGANARIDYSHIEQTLSGYGEGDWLLLQNEISNAGLIIEAARQRGMTIALNPSPMDEQVLQLPLEHISYFILNEIEGSQLIGETKAERICDEMLRRFPRAKIVLTLGHMGSCYADGERRLFQPVFPTRPVDTTAAGDTFTGYFLAGITRGDTPEASMRMAAAAASITVSRPGAGISIPGREETKRFLETALKAAATAT